MPQTLSPSTVSNAAAPEQGDVPLIRELPRVTRPADQALVLAALDETALLQTLSTKTQIQDPSWLRTGVQGGLVDVAYDLSRASSERDAQDIVRQFCQRSNALTGFMKNSTWEPLNLDELQGGPIAVPVFRADEAFKAQFHASVERIVENYAALCRHPVFGHLAFDFGHPTIDSNSTAAANVPSTMGRLMAAASLMDAPETLQLLTQAYPKGVEAQFPLQTLGDAFYEYVHHLPPIDSQAFADHDDAEKPVRFAITPAFVALMLSRTECLDVLHDVDPQGAMVLGSVYNPEAVRTKERENFDITSVTNFYAPVCTPEAFTHALQRFVQADNAVFLPGLSQPLREDLQDIGHPVFHSNPPTAHERSVLEQAEQAKTNILCSAANALLPNTAHHSRPFIGSYRDLGLFDADPARAVSNAVVYGHPDVLDRFKDAMPWDGLLCSNDAPIRSMYHFSERNPLVRASHPDEARENQVDGSHEATILAYIGLAERDGKLDEVLAHGSDRRISLPQSPSEPRRNDRAVQPVAALAELDMPRVVLKYLENGLDARERPDERTPSLLETTEAQAPQVAKMIRTFLAQQVVKSMMDDVQPAATLPMPTPHPVRRG